jgi:hypothetical protein
VPPARLVPVSQILTGRSCADGVGASLPFGVVGGGLRVGYVCLYEPASGTPASVRCGFDLLRFKDGRPAPWIAQGDVVRAQNGALVLGGLLVSPSADEIGMGGGSFFTEPEPGPQGETHDNAGDEDEEAAALQRMADVLSLSEQERAVQVPRAHGGVTSAVLRDVPLGWVHMALAETPNVRAGDGLMWLRDALQPAGVPWFGHAVADGAEVPRPRPGRPPLADEHLRLVAELVLQESGPGRNARVGGKLHLPATTVRDHIAAARRAHWLAPTRPGRRDAAPGPRLLAAWEEGQ